MNDDTVRVGLVSSVNQDTGMVRSRIRTGTGR